MNEEKFKEKIHQTLDKLKEHQKPINSESTRMEKKTHLASHYMASNLHGKLNKLSLKDKSRCRKVLIAFNNLYNWIWFNTIEKVRNPKYAEYVLLQAELYNKSNIPKSE